MQLHLEAEELKLLADLLLEQDQGAHADLLDKVLARDLRFDSDELEHTADLLAAREHDLKRELAQQSDLTCRPELQRRLALVERVLEKVNEACVMF